MQQQPPQPGNPYASQSPFGQPQSPYGQPQSPYGQPQSPYGAPPNPSPYGQAPNPYAAPSSDPGAWGGMGMGMNDAILASPGSRLAGALLDGLVYVVGMIPFFMFAGMSGGGDEGFGMLLLIVPLVFLVGLQWYLISTSGQSVAKRMLGMKIVKVTGDDVDFVSGVIMRSWVPAFIGAIPLVGHIFSIVDPLFIFGDEHQCLHDRIAGTKVISV